MGLARLPCSCRRELCPLSPPHLSPEATLWSIRRVGCLWLCFGGAPRKPIMDEVPREGPGARCPACWQSPTVPRPLRAGAVGAKAQLREVLSTPPSCRSCLGTIPTGVVWGVYFLGWGREGAWRWFGFNPFCTLALLLNLLPCLDLVGFQGQLLLVFSWFGCFFLYNHEAGRFGSLGAGTELLPPHFQPLGWGNPSVLSTGLSMLEFPGGFLGRSWAALA